MKVVLVDPPWHRLFGSHYNGLPLGICYISSYLNSKGIDCSVYNGDFLDTDKYQSQLDRLHNYDKYLNKINNKDDKIWKDTSYEILFSNPDIIGISVNQVTLKSALNLAYNIKRIDNSKKIVFGGPYPTIAKELYEVIDSIVIGEGEIGMESFINNPSKIVYGGYAENINLYPYPDRDNLYFKGSKIEYGHIITGRGCPFDCIFCASRNIWGKRVRLRSVSNIIGEIDELILKYKCNKFIFRDDTFTIDDERIKNICKELKHRNTKWQCDTRIDNLNKNTLKLMQDAGCYSIRIGVESGDERMLKFINKKITKEEVRQVVKDAKDLGISITTYFIVGLPTEGEKEIKKTLEFVKELDPDIISISIATPYYGTKLKDMMNMNNDEIEKYFHQSPDLLNKLSHKKYIEELFELADNKKRRI